MPHAAPDGDLRGSKWKNIALLSGAIVVALSAAPSALGQRRSPAADALIVRDAQRVASESRVDLYQHGLVADPALALAAQSALARMEALLGRRLDESTLGPRVRVYVSASVAVSHVWRGYEHPRDPRAILFLSPPAAAGALSGENATYAHELAHLLAWRYRSHTLREGLADYLALQLHPGAAVGPNTQGYASPPAVSSEIEEYLGTTRAPPAAAVSDDAYRRSYYYASYRFVRHLIERKGMEVFLKLYDAENPEDGFQSLYGATREELVLAAAR